MADNGCQPTSVAFMQACRAMGLTQAFTSYNNPKGNADTESLMRTVKEELVWIQEWTSPVEFIEALDGWVKAYNTGYLHSALQYQTPMECVNNNIQLAGLSCRCLDKWGALKLFWGFPNT